MEAENWLIDGLNQEESIVMVKSLFPKLIKVIEIQAKLEAINYLINLIEEEDYEYIDLLDLKDYKKEMQRLEKKK